MDVFITYKDTPRGNPDCMIRGVNEFAHNSQMRILTLRTEKRAYVIIVLEWGELMLKNGISIGNTLI